MQLAHTPALARLEWVLDALGGAELTSAQVADAMSPGFLHFIAAEAYVERMRTRAAEHAPVTVIGVDLDAHTARAKVRSRSGRVFIIGCVVDTDGPHRIANTWMMDEVPTFLSPPLPADFGAAGSRKPPNNARLIVLSGVPGTGKSTLADAIGKALNTSPFAGDWLLGALTPYGGYHWNNLFGIVEELLTTLALRQLELGQSAILDFPTECVATRQRWQSLAEAYGAEIRPIVCICTDTSLHRRRAEQRQRAIPGWHDAGDWEDIQRRIADFPPWPGDALTIDAIHPLEQSVRTALDYIRR